MWVEKNKGLTTSVIRLCLSSGPGGTRIPNLLIRSQMLYPIKLRVLSFAGAKIYQFFEISVKEVKKVNQPFFRCHGVLFLSGALLPCRVA